MLPTEMKQFITDLSDYLPGDAPPPSPILPSLRGADQPSNAASREGTWSSLLSEQKPL